ncbi:MAG: GntR family transcriptional regulator [Eubacteriales bacterium]|nr:GntR family transcriptional regulator [Eubacteriales bacterium]
MDKNFSDNLPIYMQIMKKISQAIVSGEMKVGERIPSVRELADLFGVNPNTMQRALSELEREGLVISNRTAGRFVTEDINKIDRVREDMARETIFHFMEEIKALGYSKEEIKNFFQGDAIERVG